MRICLICTEKLPVPPVRGGAIQTYIDGVLPWLRLEHEVTVVCRRDESLPDREMVDGVRYVRVDSGNAGTYFGHVTAFLAAEPPFDLVEVFNRPAYLPAVAAAAGGARLILSMHNDMFDPDRLPLARAREVLTQVERVVTISDYVGRRIDRFHPGFAHKLRTIRSGVDLERFRPPSEAERAQAKERVGLQGRPVVLHVSRHSPNKGSLLVVRAMESVLRSHPDAALLMVGSARYGSDEPDAYSELVHREAHQRLGDAVRFTGFVPPGRVHELFAAGDLFLCASQWQEPLARIHYEAMAAGLPIITTDRGGNAEVVEEGGNGLIARPHDDPEAFAGHICRLLDDWPLRAALGCRGRELAEERYGWDQVARELLEVFAGR